MINDEIGTPKARIVELEKTMPCGHSVFCETDDPCGKPERGYCERRSNGECNDARERLLEKLIQRNAALEKVAEAARECVGELGMNQSIEELEKQLAALDALDATKR